MSCVILGAGKIARGFIGHLLYLSNIPFLFIEKNEKLVSLINKNGKYHVHVLGNDDACCTVTGVNAISFSDQMAAGVIADADVVFTAVGGKNLPALIPLLAKAVILRAESGKTGNIITCENWKQPADILRRGIAELLTGNARKYFDTAFGITEAVIMRSAIEANEEQLALDPLVVNVQNYWRLPVDASRIVGELPSIEGLERIESFTGFLERKFYTYNAANGTVSYLGALLGYKHIADAAHDERILKVLEGVYSETAHALSAKHHFPLEEQFEFAKTSKVKLQDYTIVDYIERNARDPLRKLGPDDRLVGSARLVMEYGICPDNLAIAIAAALFYENSQDDSAEQLRNLRITKGIPYILENVCKIDPKGKLAHLIEEKIILLREWGWINNKEKTEIAIIGAGKTGRGFLCRLAAESGKRVLLIDKNRELVRSLTEHKHFETVFFGNVRPAMRIENFDAVTWDQAEFSDIRWIFVSVGGKNLPDVAKELCHKLTDGKKRFIITAENASHPAQILRDILGDIPCAVSESTVFCTTIEKAGCDILSENYPYLQCDGIPLAGEPVPFAALRPLDNFGNFLTRKLYTYNAASCVIAYLGAVKGYIDYGAAANDPEILPLLDRNYTVTNDVLCREYGYDPKDQEEFALLSRKKFLDRTVADTIARNAREPQRKLTHNERVISPALLMEKYGKDNSVLLLTAAAMLLYTHPDETEWNALRGDKTPAQILEKIAGLDPDCSISLRILRYYDLLIAFKKHGGTLAQILNDTEKE